MGWLSDLFTEYHNSLSVYCEGSEMTFVARFYIDISITTVWAMASTKVAIDFAA